MRKPASHPAPQVAIAGAGITRIVDLLSFAAMVLIPLALSFRFADPFRQPKVLILHGVGIALIGSIAAAAIAGSLEWREIIRPRLPDILAVACVAWSIVCAIFATHRRIAVFGVLTAASAAALFLALRWGARRYRMYALLPIVLSGVVNAGLAIVQEAKIWNQLVPLPDRSTHAGTVALQGNPNYVGSFLVPCLIATLAWMLATRQRVPRLLLGSGALLIGAGILASRTRGAFLGAAAGILVLTIVRWGRAGLFRVIALGVIAALAAATYTPFVDIAMTTDIEVLVSGRVIPFVAAWEMFKDHPVFGVGPGCFEFLYFDYAASVYPSMIEYAIAGKQMNFSETHNDHLQILAETGLIGYLLFLGAMVTLVTVSRKQSHGSERARFGRLCAAPLAVALFALALFQFPLYLPAPLTAFVALAALTIRWSEDDVSLAA